jgi:hypothetical protein
MSLASPCPASGGEYSDIAQVYDLGSVTYVDIRKEEEDLEYWGFLATLTSQDTRILQLFYAGISGDPDQGKDTRRRCRALILERELANRDKSESRGFPHLSLG